MWCPRRLATSETRLGRVARLTRATDVTDGRQGFALLLVIWTLALVALIAAGVAADSSSGSVIARNRVDIARARTLADSGVALAIAGVLDVNRSTRWAADGAVRDLELDGGSVAVAVEDEGGKIDINHAPAALIAGLADELRVGSDVRAALVQGVTLRRKAYLGSVRPPTGRVFRGADMFDVMRQPFDDPSELLLLPGITAQSYRRIAPYLTVFSQSGTLNPATASREALLAVPGISVQEVEFYLARRGRGADELHKVALSDVGPYVQPAEVRAVTVVAKATTGAGATFIRQAVVLLEPEIETRPYRVVRWQQLEQAPSSTRAAGR